MTGPTPPNLTLLAAFDLLRNKKPADLTADEIAGLRDRLEVTSPAMLVSVGGPEKVKRYLEEAEAALKVRQAEEARAPQKPVQSAETAPRDPRRTRRSIEIILYVAAVALAAWGLYALLSRDSSPPQTTKNGNQVKKSVASSQSTSSLDSTKNEKATASPAAPEDDAPTGDPPPDSNDPNLWLGWQIERNAAARVEQKDDWDNSDPSNPVPAKTLQVFGGPLKLTRTTAAGADDRWLMVDARPLLAAFPPGQIALSIDGKEVAKASIGAGDSDWPLYVPLASSQQARRQLEIVFSPGAPQQQVVFWKAGLAASQTKMPQPESPLIAPLKSADAAVRAQGAAALNQVVDPLALGALVRLLKDASRDVRRAAVTTLAKYNAGTPAFVVDALVERLRDVDPEIRRLAAQSLMSFDTDTTWVALTQTMTTHRDTQLRLQIAQQLAGRQHPVVRPAFEKLLAGQDDALRLTAVNSLAPINDPVVTALLIRMLDDPEPAVRRTAAGVLVPRQDEAAATALIAALSSHSDMLVRRIALSRFQSLPTIKALPALHAALSSPDDILRRSAVAPLARLKGDEVQALLLQLYSSPDPNVRNVAVDALVNQPGEAAEDLLLRALASPDEPALRQMAMRRFAQWRFSTPRVIPILREAIKNPSATVRFELVEGFRALRMARIEQAVHVDSLTRAGAMESLGKPPWSDLVTMAVQLLDDPNPRVRAGAAGMLRADSDPGAHDLMLRLFASQDVLMRQLAAGRYPNYATPSEKTLPFHKQCLQDPDMVVRTCAVSALTQPQFNTREVAALLATAFDDPAEQVRTLVQHARRRNPAEVLNDAILPAEAKVAGPQAIPVLISLLNDPKPSVRHSAALRLSQNPDAAAEQSMVQAIKSHPDVAVRRCAIAGLTRKPPSPAVIELMKEVVRSPDAEMREMAMHVLIKAPTPETISLITPLLGDPAHKVRLATATMLSQTPATFLEDTVLPLLGHPDWQIRQQAVQRFHRWPTPKAIPGLSQAVAAPEWEVGLEALRALGQQKDPAVFAQLAKALNSPIAPIRAVAAEILRGRAEPECAQIMLGALASSPHLDVRINAAARFEGQPNPAAIAGLVTAARHDDDGLRAIAVRALGRLPEPAATAMIAEALNDAAPEVRQTAAATLVIRRDDASEAAMIAALTSHNDIEVRRVAATRFHHVPTAKAVPALASVLKHDDDQLRLLAVQGLQRTPVEAIDALIAALDDPSENVRQVALGTLSPQPDPKAKAAVAAYMAKLETVQ